MNSLKLRIRALVKVLKDFPELGTPRAVDFEKWVRSEFGSLTVLEQFEKRGDHHLFAVAPNRVLIIGAGNLIVSLWQSLVTVLLAGSPRVIVKPGSGTEKELNRFLKKLPGSLQARIQVVKEVLPEDYGSFDAVVALGSDETLAQIQKRLTPKQRWIAYGHRLSGIWIEKTPQALSVYESIVRDLVSYDQQGCLSPRWIGLGKEVDRSVFCNRFVQAFQSWEKSVIKKSEIHPLTPSEEAMIFEIRQLHRALGNPVECSQGNLLWTVVFNRKGIPEINSLPRLIEVFQGSQSDFRKRFSNFKGDLSTVGYHQEISSSMEKFFIEWGASRFCPVGKMQQPPLDWLHDGRPSLSDLVRWVQRE